MCKHLKKILIAIFISLFIFSLVSCDTPREQPQISIQLMHGWGGSKPIHESMRNIYSDFREWNHNINLSFIAAPENSTIIDRAWEMMDVNKMADIVSTNGIAAFVQYAVKKDMALDLMPYIQEDDSFRTDIDPSVFSTWVQPDGALYTIPDALEVMGYWYNEKILQNAGVSEPPRTWPEFWRMCKKINLWAERENKDVTVFSLEKEQVVESLLLARLAGSTDGREMALGMPESYDNAAFRKTLEDIRTAYSYSRRTDRIEDARQHFRDGKMAVYCNGLWEYEEIIDGESAQYIRFANYPTETGESLSYVSPASGYVLYKSGDKAREDSSVQFLKYILSDEQQKRIMLETGQIPSNPNISPDLIEQQSPLLASALQSARAADIQIMSIGNVWNGRAIDLLKLKIDSLGTGKITTEQIIYELNNLH